MYTPEKIMLDNGAILEIIGQKVLCFDNDHRAIHLTPASESILRVLAKNINSRVSSPELYAAYNEDSKGYTLKDCGPCVSKEIYTLPSIIRDKIDNVRGKGYRLTGQKIQVIPEAETDRSMPLKCVLKSTHFQTKPVFVIDKHRAQLFENIDRLFCEGHKAVFIRGLGGIGKSELAKQYARKKLNDKTYSTVVFAPIDVKRGNRNLQSLICDDVIFSITNFPKRNEIVVLNESGSVERQSESLEDYFNRKYSKIREICDSDTLIIIDNFDVDYDREIIRFLEGNYHVIITTRYQYPDIACPQIEVEHMDYEALRELFFKNSKRTDISSDDPILGKIFDLLGQHTMSIELFAKYMAENDMMSVADIYLQLQKKGSLANLDDAIQISSTHDEQKPFEYIMALFDISSLQSERHSKSFEFILSCMSLMPLEGVKKYDFLKWCGIKSATALNKLIQRSWIFEELRDGTPWLSMHSVISEVMRYRFKPDFNNCKHFIQSLHHISFYGYHQTLEEVSHIFPVLKRILHLCPINHHEHCEIYIAFAKFFAAQEETDTVVDILSSLQAYAQSHHISDPRFYGYLCEGYGYHFRYLRKDIESAQWRKKGISYFQIAGGFSDRILELKREIVWNYIHQGDIPGALSAAVELDTWLMEAPEGTQRRGQMLHLKARLEYAQGHYNTAIIYDKQALEIFESTHLGMDCGSAYHVLGLCYAKSTETFDLGIAYLKKCLALWQRHRTESSTNIVDIHRMIADAYFDHKHYHDALTWYQKCIKLLANQSTEIHSKAIKDTILLQIFECQIRLSP